jgi:hypothetical protein
LKAAEKGSGGEGSDEEEEDVDEEDDIDPDTLKVAVLRYIAPIAVVRAVLYFCLRCYVLACHTFFR